jgi:hypothetical protein
MDPCPVYYSFSTFPDYPTSPISSDDDMDPEQQSGSFYGTVIYEKDGISMMITRDIFGKYYHLQLPSRKSL